MLRAATRTKRLKTGADSSTQHSRPRRAEFFALPAHHGLASEAALHVFVPGDHGVAGVDGADGADGVAGVLLVVRSNLGEGDVIFVAPFFGGRKTGASRFTD